MIEKFHKFNNYRMGLILENVFYSIVYCSKYFLKKYVFKFFLKIETVSDFLIASGSLFHNVGAAELNARPPVRFNLKSGIISFLLSVRVPVEFLNRQFMYSGDCPCRLL